MRMDSFAASSFSLVLVTAGLGLCMACGGSTAAPREVIEIAGSSTLYPLTVAAAEEFRKTHPNVRLNIASTGTGAGFERFCKGDLDLQDASRPIEPAEVQACGATGIGFIEVPIAHDAVTLIVPKSNTWASSLTTAELKRIWEPAAEGRILRWKQVRADWPDEPLVLFGPGVRSGTFDFFTQVIVGIERSSRTDFTASEDDDEIVNGVASNPHALGYVGFVHLDRHRDRLRAVPIDDLDHEIGPGAVEPSVNTVRRGLYRPLSRPLFLYVRTQRLDRPAVKAFVDFYTRNAHSLAAHAGTIALNPLLSDRVQQRVVKRVEGSIFARPDAAGRSLDQLLDQ